MAGSLAGLILAGGRSSRFGSEKAVAELEGAPLLVHVLSRLQPACALVAVSAREGSGAAALAVNLGLPVLHDDPGGAEGPLAGVRAGLAWAAGQAAAGLVVLPCDAPFLPQDVAVRLAEALENAPAAYAQSPAGPQPLCSAWNVDLLARVEEALTDGGHPSVIGFLRGLGAQIISYTDEMAFRNVNRPADLPPA